MYVANNPIKLIDLKGDSITFITENKDLLKKVTILVNDGAGSNVAKIGKDGILSIKNLSDKQYSKLTNEQKEFYDIMKDASNSAGMATIGVVSGSEDVLIGSWNLEKIDIADMDAIGEGIGMNKYSTFIHEIVEQNYKQTNESSSYSVGHFLKAIPAEQKVSGYLRGTEYSKSGGVLVFPYTKVGNGTINVHLKVNRENITSIERKK